MPFFTTSFAAATSAEGAAAAAAAAAAGCAGADGTYPELYPAWAGAAAAGAAAAAASEELQATNPIESNAIMLMAITLLILIFIIESSIFYCFKYIQKFYKGALSFVLYCHALILVLKSRTVSWCSGLSIKLFSSLGSSLKL